MGGSTGRGSSATGPDPRSRRRPHRRGRRRRVHSNRPWTPQRAAPWTTGRHARRLRRNVRQPPHGPPQRVPTADHDAAAGDHGRRLPSPRPLARLHLTETKASERIRRLRTEGTARDVRGGLAAGAVGGMLGASARFWIAKMLPVSAATFCGRPSSPRRRRRDERAAPRSTLPTVWITHGAGRSKSGVALASPVSQPPSVPQCASSSGPTARWIAPSTPLPPSRLVLAALTMASDVGDRRDVARGQLGLTAHARRPPTATPDRRPPTEDRRCAGDGEGRRMHRHTMGVCWTSEST